MTGPLRTDRAKQGNTAGRTWAVQSLDLGSLERPNKEYHVSAITENVRFQNNVTNLGYSKNSWGHKINPCAGLFLTLQSLGGSLTERKKTR